jgi:hypothetical protein
MKFQKKPIIIDAIQFFDTSERLIEIQEFVGDTIIVRYEGVTELVVDTLEGKSLAHVGDWIVKGIEGEVYPVKRSIFEKTYEEL